MSEPTPYQAGRHFLQIPGPTNVPDSVLRAMAQPTIDHRGPKFPELTFGILTKLATVFNTASPIFIYPSSGTGAWECALINSLSPGDKVLAFETGHFATLWKNIAEQLGLDVIWIEGDWRHGVDASIVEEKLKEDSAGEIKAVLAVYTETSTGVTSQIPKIRDAIDAADHLALFMVDTVSSLACSEYRHDDWKVDVTVSGSQKGLMLPPVEVSVYTASTAFICPALSSLSFSSTIAGSTPWRQSPSTQITSRPSCSAIFFHKVAKCPVSNVSTLSPGDKLFISADSQAPVPEEG